MLALDLRQLVLEGLDLGPRANELLIGLGDLLVARGAIVCRGFDLVARRLQLHAGALELRLRLRARTLELRFRLRARTLELRLHAGELALRHGGDLFRFGDPSGELGFARVQTLFEQLGLLGDLLLQLGFALSQTMLKLGLSLGGLPVELGQPRRGLAGERGLAFGQLALRLCVQLLQLRLELFACAADAVFQVGLTLDELGAMRSFQAVELRASGPELFTEHRCLLLLGAERPHLVSDVVELRLGSRELTLRGLHRLARMQRLDVHGVEIFLHLLGARGLRLQGVELPAGERELRVCAFEFRSKPDRLLLDLPGLAIELGVVLDLGLLGDVPGELVAFGAHRLQLTLEQTGVSLGLQQPILDDGIGSSGHGPFLDEPLSDVELLERLAVLILDDAQPLLGGGRAFLRLPSRLGLFTQTGVRCFDRAGDNRPGRDAIARREEARAGVRDSRQSHHPVQEDEGDDDADRHQDGVVAPRAAGGDDRVVGTAELDRGGDRAVAAEPQRNEHEEHAVVLFGGNGATRRRVVHARPSFLGTLSDQGPVGRIDDRAVRRPDGNVVPRGRVEKDGRDVRGDQIGLGVACRGEHIARKESEGERVVRDRLGLFGRALLRFVDGLRTKEHRADRADGKERRKREQQRPSQSVDVSLAGHRSP